jgi:hypothetical protein
MEQTPRSNKKSNEAKFTNVEMSGEVVVLSRSGEFPAAWWLLLAETSVRAIS